MFVFNLVWEREMFYLTMHSTHFIYGYGIRHMVKDHSDSEKENPLSPHRLLLLINSKVNLVSIWNGQTWAFSSLSSSSARDPLASEISANLALALASHCEQLLNFSLNCLWSSTFCSHFLMMFWNSKLKWWSLLVSLKSVSLKWFF